MAYAILVGVIVLLGGSIAWKVRCRKVSDDDFQKRIGEYNRECRLVKIDYRNGQFTAEDARKRLEQIGDKHRVPHARRTRPRRPPKLPHLWPLENPPPVS